MKIDKNVPMPPPVGKRSGCSVYLWDKMKVGDSVFFDDEPKASQSNPSFAAKVWAKANAAEVSSRKEGNGVRIWRVA
jgi:hypothetical protein